MGNIPIIDASKERNSIDYCLQILANLWESGISFKPDLMHKD